MITKKKLRGGQKLSVTFRHEGDAKAKSVAVLGDFNDWTADKHTMKQRKDGAWSITVRLPRKEIYRFRYLVDGKEWLTDENADGVETSEFGSLNGLLET